jgi:hypothetical protein
MADTFGCEKDSAQGGKMGEAGLVVLRASDVTRSVWCSGI